MTLDGVMTEPFEGMPESEAENKMLKSIEQDFVIAMMRRGYSVNVRIIESKEEKK